MNSGGFELNPLAKEPRWSKSWMDVRRVNENTRVEHLSHNNGLLEFFASSGSTPEEHGRQVSKADSSQRHWESSYLAGQLLMEGHFRLFELERSGVENGRFDTKVATHAFSAIYLNQLISLAQHANFPRRFPGRILQRMNPDALPFSALGVVIGNLNEASELARMQLAAYERNYYFGVEENYPIYHFLLRLLDTILGAKTPRLREGRIDDANLEFLASNWRSEDAGSLIRPCLEICDLHVQRSSRPKGSALHEFDNGSWTRLPVEVLLLFKLRATHGLGNPHVDHPLLDSPLGRLPSEVPFEFRDLVARVYQAMEHDGFDKTAIARAYA